MADRRRSLDASPAIFSAAVLAYFAIGIAIVRRELRNDPEFAALAWYYPPVLALVAFAVLLWPAFLIYCWRNRR